MSTVAGRFHLLEPGRPGSLPRARDRETAQTVWLHDVQLPPAAMVEALARARAAVGICHPSLVTLFDVLPLSDTEVRLVYEWVASHTLAQTAGGQPLPLKRAATLVAEVADAVAELHARAIVHGAISAATVLVTLKGKAKLDRVGDPGAGADRAASPADDLVSLADLLAAHAQPSSRGVVGAQAIETLVARARSGRFESAATFASLLRRSVQTDRV